VRRLIIAAAVIALMILLPLVGAALAGRPLAGYLDLPPRTVAVAPAPFTWWAFLPGLLAVAAVITPFLVRILRHRRSIPGTAPVRAFPWWGWAALALMLAAWAVAWGLLHTPETWRRHAFTPLWLGYIGVVNAWTWRRAGVSLLTHRPGALAALLAASPVFWWLFEYLNQFVHNWHYAGLVARGDLGYFLAATPPFATVLAAVLSTRDLLATFPRLAAGLADAWRPPAPAAAPWLALGLGAAGLLAVGTNGAWFFPLLWVAPLLVIWGLQTMAGEATLAGDAARGNWRPVWLAAIAALACGLLWEMWNAGSLARWQYAVPYVGGFRLFEMPLLGYAGYLPFGLGCVAAAGLVLGSGRTDLRHGLPAAASAADGRPNTAAIRAGHPGWPSEPRR
jgi:hypothetical protein